MQRTFTLGRYVGPLPWAGLPSGCLGVKLAALLPRADFFYYGKGGCIRVRLDLEGATQGHSRDYKLMVHE